MNFQQYIAIAIHTYNYSLHPFNHYQLVYCQNIDEMCAIGFVPIKMVLFFSADVVTNAHDLYQLHSNSAYVEARSPKFNHVQSCNYMSITYIAACDKKDVEVTIQLYSQPACYSDLCQLAQPICIIISSRLHELLLHFNTSGCSTHSWSIKLLDCQLNRRINYS